ncbi:hypothetical protein CH333_05615 [candidate division WOR-3 bacterium JGI_Cruoil_03_44_89]|uniref:Uncharacterized protein n=1 Tax=candidate division WOR-3 bacterium JGI_Cruoil_03_44_89 TaxID=1973748 RepID=A0A235BSK5_UNCW3|nr:MAG: hypothetical protein CH333_05615 [candidate division WOR-3 bacterium JGI_Cruoil_03_44_89]
MHKKEILSILFLGSLWGYYEVAVGGALYGVNVPYAGVFLSIIALGILGMASKLIPRLGSATLIAATASLFRLVNAGPHYCHLLAILLLGVGFDIAKSMVKREKPILIGISGAYIGYVLFAFTITYLFRYHYWVSGGLPKVLRYVGINGTLAAMGGSVSVWLGYNLGKIISNFLKGREKFAYTVAIGLIFIIWTVGKVL